MHVDVVNDLIDAERKVEASSAVCKKPLRYVVAFAGNGAKDVTRRSAPFARFLSLCHVLTRVTY